MYQYSKVSFYTENKILFLLVWKATPRVLYGVYQLEIIYFCSLKYDADHFLAMIV